MNFKKYIGATIGFCIAATSLYGCSPAQNRAPDGRNQSYNVPGQRLSITRQATPPTVQPSPSALPNVMQSVPQTVLDTSQRADNIKSKLSQMPEVKQAHVAIVGNNALVGISPTNTSQDANVLKSKVVDTVKSVDKGVAQVTVSESPDIMARIGNLSNDLVNRRPMNEVTAEFNQIVKSIVPMSR